MFDIFKSTFMSLFSNSQKPSPFLPVKFSPSTKKLSIIPESTEQLSPINEENSVKIFPQAKSPKKPLSDISNLHAVTPNLSIRKKPETIHYSNSISSSLGKTRIISYSKFSIENLKPDADFLNRHFDLPMTGTRVMSLYRHFLTQNEVVEIRKYETVYYFGHKAKKLSEGFTDRNGIYKAMAGDHLGYRYEILEMIGKGTFGHVYKCFDYKHNQLVAVKIIRRNSNTRKQGENEVKILETLNDQDPDTNNLVRLLQCFEFRGHLCITYELLSMNLYQFLRKNDFRGLNLNLIKRIASQILRALKYIHSFGLFHCDLKLENILLKSESKTSIKVIDFGSAIGNSNPLFTYLQSRYYRAPEVILGCGYDEKIDIWSFGCILVELYTGQVLFPGENERDQLLKIIQVIGDPPEEILERSMRKNVFFNDSREKAGVKFGLSDIIRPKDKEEIMFEDFVKKLLVWETNERLSAEEALKHAWIKGGVREVGGVSKGRLLFNS